MNKLSEKVNFGIFKSHFWKAGKFFDKRSLFMQFIDNQIKIKSIDYYENIESSMAFTYMQILTKMQNGKIGDSKAEEAFFNILHINNIQFEFQKKIGPYFPDFIIGKLIIEIDGPHHWRNKNQREFDDRRDIYLQKQGYTVLRLRLHTFILNIPKVLKIIKSLSDKINGKITCKAYS